MKTTSKSILARVNKQQPATLYEKMYFQFLSKCQQVAPRHSFSFKSTLLPIDTTTIALCFPLATFRSRKGAIKLHVGLDADGYLPAFMDMTTGKVYRYVPISSPKSSRDRSAL